MRHSDESLAYKQIIRALFSFRFGGLYLCSALCEDEGASDKWAHRFCHYFSTLKKAYVQVIPQRTVCRLVKMMIIMDDP